MTLLFDENFPHYLPPSLRPFGVDVQHSTEHLPPGTDDLDVYPFLKKKGWAWMTFDHGIIRKPHERAAFMAQGVGGFVFVGTLQRTPLDMLRLVLARLREIETLAASTKPPFIFRVPDKGKIERIA